MCFVFSLFPPCDLTFVTMDFAMSLLSQYFLEINCPGMNSSNSRFLASSLLLAHNLFPVSIHVAMVQHVSGPHASCHLSLVV